MQATPEEHVHVWGAHTRGRGACRASNAKGTGMGGGKQCQWNRIGGRRQRQRNTRWEGGSCARGMVPVPRGNLCCPLQCQGLPLCLRQRHLRSAGAVHNCRHVDQGTWGIVRGPRDPKDGYLVHLGVLGKAGREGMAKRGRRSGRAGRREMQDFVYDHDEPIGCSQNATLCSLEILFIPNIPAILVPRWKLS